MILKRAVGIDLGTTNSALAVMSPGGHKLVLFEDSFKRKTFPSVVGWHPEEGHFVSGWEAWNRRALDPKPVMSIKRRMGTQRAVEIGPNELKPDEVSGQILSALQAAAEPALKAELGIDELEMTDAVITVPAYFDAPQIEATKRAGEMAGLNVLSLVQEPTAAAMYHAWNRSIGDGTFLVYDLGGGTFDVSIIRSVTGEYQVLGIDGDNFLGGDDFDRRLAEHFRQHLVEQGYALDLDLNDSDDAVRFYLLTNLARETKEALSSADVHYVARRDMFEDQDGNLVTLEMDLSRETFEGLIQDLVDQTIECCKAAISHANEAADITMADIDYVLLVGGSTRVPLVRNAVQDQLCSGQTGAGEPIGDAPDTAVALGAAIQAANRGGLTWSEEDASLTVTTSLYTNDDSLTILGKYTGVEDVESIVLLDDTGEIASLSRPQAGDDSMRFELDGIEVSTRGDHAFDLELCDEEGDPLFSVTLPVRRGRDDEYRPTGSALSNPSVLAKDIYLQVTADGRADRQLLVPRGSGLPCSDTFRFRTADSSGAVILRLFQNRFPIRTIHLAIPEDTELGTPVDLNLKVDETMTIVADGEVAGQRFWAQIEAPPPAEERDWASIEKLLQDVEEVQRALWGYEARRFRQDTDLLVAGIRETARTDPDKLQALVIRLEDIVDEFRNRETALTPAWSRFEVLLDAIKRIVFRGDGGRQLGLSTAEWRDRLGSIEEVGRTAYADHNQEVWSQTFNQVQAIWESLAQDEFRFSSNTNPGEQVARMEGRLRELIDELRSEIGGFARSLNPETRVLQDKEIASIEAELAAKIEDVLDGMDLDEMPPNHAKPALDRLFENASLLRRRLERLPNIGVVSK